MDFSEVTGVRALSFRNVSVGEIPPEAGRWAKLPRRYVAEKTSPGALELKKSPSSLRKYELCKGLYQCIITHFRFTHYGMLATI
ncbi:MAG TPA: hypothetical protein VMW09_08745 [Desulfatiglandales bacterium]|nr:hypothetical protein [Desulfatiglandales bacterium]